MNETFSPDAIRAHALPLMARSLESCRRLLAAAETRMPALPGTQAQLLASRLAPDMLCLAHQVQVLADSLTGACALLCGDVASPCAGWVFNRGDEAALGAPDRSVGESIARVDAALVRFHAVSPATPMADPGAALSVARPGHVRHFVVDDFVWRYVLPNAGFHVTMVHALLRAQGVPIGKADFEGTPVYTVDSEPAAAHEMSNTPRPIRVA
jgi:hypothetical protein